jgi:hypothetical protein
MNFTLPWKRNPAAKAGLTGCLQLAAAAAWLAALVVLAQAGLASLSAPSRIRARLADLSAVAAQEATIEAAFAAKEAFVAAHPPDATPRLVLAMLAGKSLSGAATNSITEIRRTPLNPGTAVRVQVEAEQAPLAALSPFIETAEAADPPWRLVALSIEPDSPKPGKGRVRLEFETIMIGASIVDR